MTKRSIFLATAACASPVVAAEGSANNPFAGDIGNAIWTVVVFVLVVFVLGKWAWRPILNALQKREQFILDALEQAKKDRDQAAKQLEEYTERLQKARSEASAIVEEGRRDAEVLRHRLEEQAKSEARATLDRAKREIGIARDTAVKELYTLSGRLATDMASRILRKELNEKEHERFLSESIEELEQTVSLPS